LPIEASRRFVGGTSGELCSSCGAVRDAAAFVGAGGRVHAQDAERAADAVLVYPAQTAQLADGDLAQDKAADGLGWNGELAGHDCSTHVQSPSGIFDARCCLS
jgi:hypothetical protein